MRQKIWIVFLLCLLGLWDIKPVQAEVLPDVQVTEDQDYSIAFFPQPIPIYLQKNLPPKANIDVSVLRKNLIAQAEHHPYLRVISASDIEAAFNHAELRQTDAFMQAEIDIGYAHNFMENMNYASAIELLRRAIDNYQKSFTQYYRQKQVAQAWQMLAYALIAQYQENSDEDVPDEPSDNKAQPARLAFVELIRLAPYLTMLEGRQSPERVRLYDEALELFLSNELYRQTSKKDATALAHKIGADILVIPRIVQDSSGNLFLEIDTWNAVDEQMQYLKQELTFPETSQEQYVADTASLMLSNTYDCLKVETAIVEDEPLNKAHRFALEVGATYASHVRHPTEDFLNNIGGHISLSYMFDSHFFIRVQGEILTILQDKAHELYDNFEIYQIPVFLGLAQDWQWIRIYLMLGLDFSFSTPYTISKSTTCKTFGTNDIECDPKDVTTNHDPFAMLIDFVIGLSFGKDPFYVIMEGTASVTTWPSDGNYFKHMMGARLGIQYWF